MVEHNDRYGGQFQSLGIVTLLKAACLLALLVIATINFKTNFLSIAPQSFFETFQTNGEARVLGGIYAKRTGIGVQYANLGHVAQQGVAPDELGRTFNQTRSYEILDGKVASNDLQFEAYSSHFGLQVPFYGWISDIWGVGINKDTALRWVPSALNACAIFVLALLFARLINPIFGTLFFVSLAFAPTPIAFGHNLYWNFFLFLLPAICCALAFLSTSPTKRLLLIGAGGIAVMLKCLSNYEYVTSIIVLGCTVFLIAPYFNKNGMSVIAGMRFACLSFVILCSGFVGAFVIHSANRADTVSEGARLIFAEDVLRRTYGSDEGFEGETAESLQATIPATLEKLWKTYPGRELMIMPRKVATAMFLLVLLGFAFLLIARPRKFPWGDAFLLASFVALPLSWYIAAKGHAYTQTHIGFVLLYIGFFPALIYTFFSVGLRSAGLALEIVTGSKNDD